MFFTREDILKIQKALLQLGVKDSELPSAEPVTYDDTLSIVQDGENKQIGVKDFFNQISLWKREDFLNITDRYDEHYIMLLEAINLVPVLQRKDGLVITFQDTNGDWRIYQFRGNITEFLDEEKWFDLYDYKNYVIKSFLPDEEDITALTPDENGNSFLALKDRIYNPAIFSGKGYKFIRKNIINVELAVTKISVINSTTLTGNIYFKINDKGVNISLDALTHNTTRKVAEAIKDTLAINCNDYKVTVTDSVVTLIRKYSGSVSPTIFEMYNTGVRVIVEDTTTIDKRNIIIQEDINKTNTIYEIRYDFDLDGKTITIPKNCILYFTSGKFYNGSINMDNTIVFTFSEDILLEVNIRGNYYNIQKSIKDANNLIQGNTNKLNNAEKNIEHLDTRSTQMEETIKGIAATGGASQASAVTYENTESGLNSINAQGAIDELANKKFDKENIAQGFGESEDKVVSQFALPFREIESPEFLHCIVDAENYFLFGIQLDGSIEWGKGIPAPIRAKLQEIINQCQLDKTDLTEAINSVKKELLASITALQETKVDKVDGKELIDSSVAEVYSIINNSEYMEVKTDADDKVLSAIYNDGSHYVRELKSETIDDLKETKIDKDENKSLIDNEIKECFYIIKNDEWDYVIIDTEYKIVFGVRNDGKFVGDSLKLINLYEKVDVLEKNIDLEYLKALSSVIDVKETDNFDTKELSGANDSLEKDETNEYIYIGYKKRFDTLTLIKEFHIDLYKASNNDIGDEYTFLLGEVDQRNWFLPRTTFKAKVDSVTNGMLSFLFDNIIAKKGEVLMLCAHRTKNAMDEESNKIVTMYNNKARKNIPAFTRDLNSALSNVSSNSIEYPDIRVVIKGVSYNGIFPNNVSFSELQNSVTSNTDLVNKKQNIKLTDSENGKKYKLKVKNGQLVLKSLNYDKILCLGNSFTTGWYGRSLASTTDKTPYYEHMKNVSNASVVDNAEWVTLERSLLDTDFQNIPKKENNYDAILVQLGENIISTDTNAVYQTFLKAFQAIKNNWKDADVFFVFGRVIGNKPYPICKAIMQAALDEEVEYTDCSSVSLQEHSLRGDFAYDNKNNLVEISEAAYSSHPSDIGCYKIAEKVLELMGFSSTIPSRMFNIDKIQTEGGTISTASNRWVSDGLVTIQCVPNEGYNIKNIIVTKESGETIETTEKVNSLGIKCYVFLMPAENVTISANFTNV